MDFSNETATYVVLEHDHKFYQFVMCPFCKELQQTHTKKKHKVWTCWKCGGRYIEP